MRAVIYARYSSDHQREASIEDQVRLCRERAEREGWSPGQTYADQAISGATLLRPGIQALISDGMAARFDVVIAEALDRLSRDQEDIAGFYKRMTFAGIRIVTLSEGDINDLHIGLKGTMNALFLKDLADKTRRGLRGRIEAGMSGGGNSYGYAVVQQFGANGELIRGERSIDEGEARIIRRIFKEYAHGQSPRRIAWALNAEGVTAPGGSSWGASTINGNAARGTGILNNELYVGRRVWNRLRYTKNPDTGKRVSRLNPEHQWVTQDVPELRILDDTLWQQVKARQGTMQRDTRPDKSKDFEFWKHQRPKTLFSGLMRCGMCGGSYSKVSALAFGCATARNKGTCTNRATIRQQHVEERVLEGLQHHLMDPELFAIFESEFHRELNKLARKRQTHSEAAREEHAALGRKIAKLVSAVSEGGAVRALTAEIQRLEERQDQLQSQIGAYDEPAPVLIHPSLAGLYREKVLSLRHELSQGGPATAAAEIVRTLVDAIIITPAAGTTAIELRGALAGILALGGFSNAKKAPEGALEDVLQIKLVAGVGFEPTTFRL